jgi:N-acetylglucosaminyldiphosphoundecaprenol N-acetyl-beta-D-mannosaminyltransferase
MGEWSLLGVRVDGVDRESIEKTILEPRKNGRARVLAYVNINAVNIARTDVRFREIINSAALTYCDGEGVRLGGKILGRHLPPRTVLTYWIWHLLPLLQEHHLSVYFLGGKDDVVRRAVDVVRAKFPSLNIAGWHHGYFSKEGEESMAVVREINAASPDILFVGFGMPLQEMWIDSHLSALSVNVILPSGSMIDYVAGAKRVAPAWMANNGLEWLHRLVREPRRLWRRYLIGNPLFFFRILAQRIRGDSR